MLIVQNVVGNEIFILRDPATEPYKCIMICILENTHLYKHTGTEHTLEQKHTH